MKGAILVSEKWARVKEMNHAIKKGITYAQEDYGRGSHIS
jgi:hypothetical protein